MCYQKTIEMKQRINILKAEPEAYKAMMGLDHYLAGTQLDPLHKELIKIRASQINGCSYCLDKHSHDARALGETEQRLYVLNAWRETSFFSEQEQAILALTEEMTLIRHHVSDETYEKALELLGEQYLAQVMMAIIAINAWNRIGVATRMQPAARS